jgi:hypothetical protein
MNANTGLGTNGATKMSPLIGQVTKNSQDFCQSSDFSHETGFFGAFEGWHGTCKVRTSGCFIFYFRSYP